MPADIATRAPIYQHRPTRVEAMRVTSDSWRQVLQWMREGGAYFWAASNDMTEVALWLDAAAPGQDSWFRVRTPQGARKVLIGDWIVRGVGGIWYPVHDEVWQVSYEPAGDVPPRHGWVDDAD